MDPSYPLKHVKNLLKANHFRFKDPALQDAYNDFNWSVKEMVQCLLRLNDRPYRTNQEKNHFYKTEVHRSFDPVMMDYYKIKNAPEGNCVYVHFYIQQKSGMLIITSFKEL